jgi:hypothetical protein
MAIIEKTALANYLPVYNIMEWCVDSDEVGETNFKYVFRVYIEGIASYKEYQVSPADVLDYGVVDVHNYIQTFIQPDIGEHDATLGIDYSIFTLRKYYVEAWEMWDVVGVPTFNPDQEEVVTTGDLYCFQGSFNDDFWLDWTPADYYANLTNGSSGQWLTDNLLNKAGINDLGWSYVLTDAPAEIDYMEIKTYDSSGTIISTFNVDSSLNSALSNSRYLRIATSPEALNNIAGGFSLGAQPIIISTVASYTVQLFDSTSPAAVTELINFEIKEPCRYTEYRLHFENRFGAMDSFTFQGRNQKSTSMQRTSYKSSAYPIATAGIVRKHKDKSNVNNWTKRTEKIKLTSDYLTTAENDWLEQLMYSNEIYLEFTDGAGDQNFKSIGKITGNSWLEKETETDKLFKMDIEIELGHEAYSQRK